MSNLAMIGSDPEMFIMDWSSGIYHAIGLIGGSKDNPLVVPGGALQEDNVLLEFNTDPTNDPNVFADTIAKVMTEASNRIGIYGMDVVKNVSSHLYNQDILSGFPEPAFHFGCTPDYNALTGEENPTPSCLHPNLRTAGGHVHIGWNHLKEVNKKDQESVGVMCDYFLGLPSLMMDQDDVRRQLYGKASAIRYKPYGVEYRTLSNFWIWEREKMLWVFNQAQKAYVAAMSYGSALRATIPPEDVQRVINTNDRAVAKAMIEVLENAS